MKTPLQIREQIKAATNEIQPQLVLKNVTFANLFTREWETADVAVHEGKIVGIGNYNGEREVDGTNLKMVPGLIDAHVHIESSMLAPSRFEQVVLPRGVTTVITDPHEIANVSGAKGIEWALKDSENCAMNILYQLPSCVPATSFEDNGARLTAADLEPFYKHEKVVGLAEVMDFPAVLSGAEDMMEKLAGAHNHQVNIDGHGAGLKGKQINAYMAAGIRTDHECVNTDEMLERVRRGMYVMLREGSAARNLADLLKGYHYSFSDRLLFCTDDKHIDDLFEEGSVDYHVRTCLEYGIDEFEVLRMASLNAAQCFGLREKGAIAPGYDADFILLDDLDRFQIRSVWVKGKEYTGSDRIEKGTDHPNSVVLGSYTKESLKLKLAGDRARVIEIIPNSIVTKCGEADVTTEAGFFAPDPENDLLKLAVVERHKGSGRTGLGIVKGFELKSGAIATTIAHDSHNIICVGTNDIDMDAAIRHLAISGGGIVIVDKGKVQASLELPIGGLMTSVSPEQLLEDYMELLTAMECLGITKEFAPLLTLSFLALPVIPSLKLTNKGLFNVETFEFVDVGI
ncbi:MAG: adenine deaminase [Bacillus sp. (in: firmicutes)]